MNTTLDQVSSNTAWKRLKLEYVTAVCGLALSIAAFAGLSGALQRENAAVQTTPVETARRSAVTAASRTPIFFVVGDLESARALESTISYEAVHPEDYRVLVVGIGDHQMLFDAMQEQTRASTHAKFIDLRETSTRGVPTLVSGESAVVETPESIGAGEAWQHGAR